LITFFFSRGEILLRVMGWGKVSIVGDVNKIWKNQEGKSQKAAFPSNTYKLLE